MILRLKPNKDIERFIANLPSRHFRPILLKLLKLLGNPYPTDGKMMQIQGHVYYYVSVGNYRIIYKILEDTLYWVLIDNRSTDDIHQLLRSASTS